VKTKPALRVIWMPPSSGRIFDAIPTAARAPPSVDASVLYEPAFA
jgi:hypothetical protein